MKPDRSFRKSERVRLDREAAAVIERGSRASSPHFTLHWAGHDRSLSELSRRMTAPRRLAVRISRRFGSAPQRNRAKRIVREVFRREKLRLRPGSDYIVSIRSFADPADVNFRFVRRELMDLCLRSGLCAAPHS